MILYDYFRSSASYRVRIALNLKGVAVERRDILLLENQQRSPEHLARNPQGFVPALEADDGHVITQSLAILDWLDARFPEPRLIPADPDARAAALARALVIAADTHPLNNLRVMRRLKDMGVDEAGRNDWTRHWIAEGFTALEAMAGDGPFLGGDAPGVADLFLVPQMYNARRFDTPLDAFPRLVAIDAACAALPAFAAARPDAVAPK
ncbi:maleylacetoacetate isomerase [Sphingomonas sp. NIBR02145]|uniref:maleylacetoacetate isomerase n=1 Tax=Sphingomonas sp. NIBR02145 TaxID=3014784 RepID=UPI0022B43781|nr:maleylacetoacetate isomerase [Sphingomonas sp. NIBR02145]WHU01304.1 maleylacetoacetate isomerase [Sphingomonas sp. NIBR02145]